MNVPDSNLTRNCNLILCTFSLCSVNKLSCKQITYISYLLKRLKLISWDLIIVLELFYSPVEHWPFHLFTFCSLWFSGTLSQDYKVHSNWATAKCKRGKGQKQRKVGELRKKRGREVLYKEV